MFDQTTWLHIGVICLLAFCVCIWVRMKFLEVLAWKEEHNEEKSSAYFSINLREKLLNSDWYQKREESIRDRTSRLYPLGVPEEYTPEGILNSQIQLIAIAGGFSIIAYIITKLFFIPILGLLFTVYAVMMPDSQINGKLKEKETDFDARLPQFENSLLMAINAGASLPKAMDLVIDAMVECPSKEEFELLRTQTKTSTSDPSFPYLELAKRVHTKDCDQFTNMIINGVRNGTSMGAILESNSASMMESEKNRIHERNEKASTSATVFTSAFVLLPMIVIFLAPMLLSSSL